MDCWIVGSWTVDRGSWIVDRGSWIVDRGLWIVDRGFGGLQKKVDRLSGFPHYRGWGGLHGGTGAVFSMNAMKKIVSGP